ncbi:MAG: helix-turn-helix domain-containing protein [Proteobacteria bacterium]|nr:helix-turn-helix domain-containing protein [Pseudomonadota bacterium]
MKPDSTIASDDGVKHEKSSVSSREDKQVGSKDKDPQRKALGNHLREYRIEQMMSKAELARKAGLSVLTIDRIEKGYGCRMDTKRKILKSLGLKLTDRRKVFDEE